MARVNIRWLLRAAAILYITLSLFERYGHSSHASRPVSIRAAADRLAEDAIAVPTPLPEETNDFDVEDVDDSTPAASHQVETVDNKAEHAGLGDDDDGDEEDDQMDDDDDDETVEDAAINDLGERRAWPPPPPSHEIPSCERCAEPDGSSSTEARLKRPLDAALPSCCHKGGSWHGQCGEDAHAFAHTWAEGVRACNVRACAKCAAVRTRDGSLDHNCCYRDAAWASLCGPLANGFAFTWKEGFRMCNNLTLVPEPPRVHDGPFVPLLPWVASVPSKYVSTLTPYGLERTADTGLWGAIPEGHEAYRVQEPSRRYAILRAYLITLNTTSVTAKAAWARLKPLFKPTVVFPPRVGEPLIPLTMMRAVAAEDALKVAGTSPSRARSVFGLQYEEKEFSAALACTLSHMRAMRRCMRDKGEICLILEDDVVDMRYFW